MKKLFALLTLFVTLTLQAADLTLVWDANAESEQVVSYTVYERSANAPYVYTLKGQTAATTLPLVAVTEQPHTYVVTATNIRGAQSDYSLPVTWVPKPSPPKNLKAVTSVAPAPTGTIIP